MVGGGGKTSLMAVAAGDMTSRGSPGGRILVLSTTTRLQRPCPLPGTGLFANPTEPPDLPVNGNRAVLWVGMETADGSKWQGPDSEALMRFAGSQDSRSTLVVEADGSAGRPVKLTDFHEPVIPDATTTVVAVMGLSALGRPAGSGTIHRLKYWEERTGGSPGRAITGEQLYRLVLHPRGCFRGARKGMRRLLVLNQADTPDLVRHGENIARRVLDAGVGVETVVVTSFVQAPAIRSIIGR